MGVWYGRGGVRRNDTVAAWASNIPYIYLSDSPVGSRRYERLLSRRPVNLHKHGARFCFSDIVGRSSLVCSVVRVLAARMRGKKIHPGARRIPSVAYTGADVAWTGRIEEQFRAEGLAFDVSAFPWAAPGRAVASGRDASFTKLRFDRFTHPWRQRRRRYGHLRLSMK